MTKFELTPAEKQSPLWLRLAAHLDARIAQHRIQNDDKAKDVAETAFLRGQILENKALRALGDDRPNTP